MNRLPDVTIKLFGREYDLAFGRQSYGATWLLAVNKDTGAVLPLTASAVPTASINAIDVFDMDNIVPALEAAGIIKRAGSSTECLGFKLRTCEIVHSGLIERLTELETRNVEKQRECQEQSR